MGVKWVICAVAFLSLAWWKSVFSEEPDYFPL